MRVTRKQGQEAKKAVYSALKKAGVVERPLNGMPRKELIEIAEDHFKIDAPEFGSKWYKPAYRFWRVAQRVKGAIIAAPPNPKKADDIITKFYRSYEWRKVRYDVLKRNDGRCELCGRSKHDGIVLHVDHIKPLRLFWELRLDPANLQVFCDECNHGKGNRDDTDWRQPQ